MENQFLYHLLQSNFFFSLIHGLTNSGTLLVICSYTFTPILHLDDLDIVDFEILSEEEESLLVLTKKPSQQLQLLSIPGIGDIYFNEI